MEQVSSATTYRPANGARAGKPDERSPGHIAAAEPTAIAVLPARAPATRTAGVPRWLRLTGSIARTTAVFVVLALTGLSAAQAANVTLNVVAARTNTPVSFYKYLINIDNTGETTQRPNPTTGALPVGCNPADPGYPTSCPWPSLRGFPTSSPVYTQGTQADFSTTASLSIPAGRYLVSVLADGYKLEGKHFTVGTTDMTVTVELQPWPLPDAQIQAAVFEDVSSTNGTPDPSERGLAGFRGHINDVLGEVTTNVYGDPLCSRYDSSGNLISGSGGACVSKCYVVSGAVDVGTVAPDSGGHCPIDTTNLTMTLEGVPIPAGAAVQGKLKIPNLGPNRYALSITPPDGSNWIQTTTLEGSHDWDAWVMEGATGLDTEFIVGGEPFPPILFGYAPGGLNALTSGTSGSGKIKGLVEAVKAYTPGVGGVGPLPGTGLGCCVGIKLDKPIERPWISLADLNNGDTAVWVGQGNADGTFEIPNVPPGNYTLTWWDEPQNYALDIVNVTVAAGETVDLGLLPMTGWWTFVDGYVFDDQNRNGKRDAGEPGLPGYTLTMRVRNNTLMDRGSTTALTDASGYYKFDMTYPTANFIVMEAYDDAHYSTGITYQADNQPNPTTQTGGGVDVSLLPIIGLSGRLDWGKHSYDATGANGVDPRNGGIVGSISYDTTRNELDPQYAAAEDWQPGVPGLRVNLYETVPCNGGSPCTGGFPNYLLNADGSYAKGKPLNTYISETWQRPTGCVARGPDGTPLVHGTDEQVLPLASDAECLEGPLMGVQFSGGGDPGGTEFPGVAVDGNYGFGDGCLSGTLDATDPTNPVCNNGTFEPLPGGRDYLVEVDLNSQLDSRGQRIYKVTREEDINIGNGDEFVPAVPPPACAGALHTVDLAGQGTDGYPANTSLILGVTVPASTPTDNATFLDIDGTPYEGTPRRLCNMKLVNLANGKSVVPMFHLFTDVPLPTRFNGLLVDDLNFTSNPKSLLYGEKLGIPFAPVAIYDYTNRLITTVDSDYNGIFEVLLPSTNRISCPTPSGVCANLYRFVGNDPGVPGRLNLNYNPQYRTIAAEFEALPGQLIPADLAPTQVGVATEGIFGNITSVQPVSCKLADNAPKLYAVSRPYLDISSGAGGAFTISGQGFGATQGTGQVTLDGAAMATTAWTDTTITVSVPNNIAAGPKQLKVTADNGLSTINGLTFHVIKTNGNSSSQYAPRIYEVGPGVSTARYRPSETLPAAANHAIQNALDDAASYVAGGNNRSALVVVYPNNPSADPRQNPRGAYYENLIVSAKVKLQGVGPGSPDGSVRGSIIDGGAFAGDSPVFTDWYTTIGGLTWDGNQTIYDGAVISIFVPAPTSSSNSSATRRSFPTTYDPKTAPSIDGFDIRGGNQQGFPANIDPITGLPTGQPGGLTTQGGAIFANAYARNLQITNNVVQNNGGAWGTIRLGTPNLPAPDTNNHNEGANIAFNRIIANAGTNLAGGIGLFNGSSNYQIVGNDICGNFSAEYGGGISAVGLNYNGGTYNATTNFGGRISNNRIYFNRSYDEGGGIMIAGELPTNPLALSAGSGPVDIFNNVIQANLANDDGGGIRFLMAGNFPMNVYNNVIANNVSTHEGGGIGLNDAPNVRIYNNTIMKNLTTNTAVTSLPNTPAPAGLSTSQNSAQLQATLPAGSPIFSNPLLFNNIFWDNRAGSRTGGTVIGLGASGDATPIDQWDLGVADGTGVLAPTNSIIQQSAAAHTFTTSLTNLSLDPLVVAPYDVGVSFNVWRNNPAFIGAILVAADLPPELMGNYHICTDLNPECSANSPAVDTGASSKTGVNAPAFDIDNQARPGGLAFDIGADEKPTRADLAITKTDNQTTAIAGSAITYTIVVTNNGPSAVTGATVTDSMPGALTNVSWTCAASSGSSCVPGNGGYGNGSINVNKVTLDLLNGGTATFTVTATVSPLAFGTLDNTATVSVPTGATDPVPTNNSATDSDTIPAPALPTLTVLDNFNRTSANNLGTSWSQAGSGNGVDIRVASNQAYVNGTNDGGQAIWNVSTFTVNQGAAFTFTNNGTRDEAALILKANSGTTTTPTNFVRVRYNTGNGGEVLIETTTNSGGSFTNRSTLGGQSFANNDTLSATADATGVVRVWKTTGTTTTYLGGAQLPTTGGNSWTTGTGRIGMKFGATGAYVDNFSGGTLP